MSDFYFLDGDVCHSGKVEIAAGTTIREIIDNLGGGIAGGKALKAVQIGGASGGLLTAEQLSLPLDFKALKEYGIRRGDSTITVLDEDRCMVDICYRYLLQTQSEFCGRCVPCREGTKRMGELLARLYSCHLDTKGFKLLLDLGEMIQVTALCNLGKGVFDTLQSAVRLFPEDFEGHLSGKCPLCSARKHDAFVPGGIPCTEKVIRIIPEKCIGCGKCARNCHVEAITGKVKTPYHIDPDKCIRCYTCIEVCPFDAVEEVEIDG